MPVSGAAFASTPWAFPAIEAAPEPPRGSVTLVRQLDPLTRDYVATKRDFERTTETRQRVLLALTTTRGSSPVLRDLGLRMPESLDENLIRAEVRRSLDRLLTERAIVVRDIQVERGALGRVEVVVTYAPVGAAANDSVRVRF